MYLLTMWAMVIHSKIFQKVSEIQKKWEQKLRILAINKILAPAQGSKFKTNQYTAAEKKIDPPIT